MAIAQLERSVKMKNALISLFLFGCSLCDGYSEFSFVVRDSILKSAEIATAGLWVSISGGWAIADLSTSSETPPKVKGESGSFLIRKPERMTEAEWRGLCDKAKKLVGKRCFIRSTYFWEPLYIRDRKIITELGVPLTVVVVALNQGGT